MPRLIAFVLCVAFLVGAGGFVRVGMTLAALAVLAVVAYVASGFVRMFLGPR